MNAGNIGNIPLVLIAALCRDESNPFGDTDKCSQDGNAYISFGQWVSCPILFYAVSVIQVQGTLSLLIVGYSLFTTISMISSINYAVILLSSSSLICLNDTRNICLCSCNYL